MGIVEVRPSDLKEWSEIDQSKAILNGVHITRVEWYGWYKSGDAYYAHRKPTLKEYENNCFN